MRTGNSSVSVFCGCQDRFVEVLGMKRLLVFLVALLMLFPIVSSSFSESNDSSVCSYDFDLFMHLNADAFPAQIRSRIQGYAELINILEFKGNLTYSPDQRSFDLNLDIIPSTNADAAISFHFFGVPDYIGISSSLFGDETIWLNNYVLMEFAYKTWNNLRIPLQYVALLYPYVTRSAFEQMTDAWHRQIGVPASDTTISIGSLQELSASWNYILQNDSRAIYWIAAVSALTDSPGVLEEEFAGLPDYLLNQVAHNQDLIVTVNDSSEQWKTRGQEVFFDRSGNEQDTSWKLSLPETANGYLPYLSFSSVRSDNTISWNMVGSYRQSGSVSSAAKKNLPDALVDFSVSFDSWPAIWPCDASFSARLYSDSIILPNFLFLCNGTSAADGSFSVRIEKPAESENADNTILTLDGTIVKTIPSSVPDYSLADLRNHESVFNINDKTMDDFIHRIWRPLFLGILDFLNEVPPKACQSIMDDLEDYGVLTMISGE